MTEEEVQTGEVVEVSEATAEVEWEIDVTALKKEVDIQADVELVEVVVVVDLVIGEDSQE